MRWSQGVGIDAQILRHVSGALQQRLIIERVHALLIVLQLLGGHHLGNFPIIAKLIEAAEYFGFDGWFINQETEGGESDPNWGCSGREARSRWCWRS